MSLQQCHQSSQVKSSARQVPTKICLLKVAWQNNLLLSIGKKHMARRPSIYIPFIYFWHTFYQKSKSVDGLTIFSHNFLYPAYTDNTTFFLNNKKYVAGFLEFWIIFPLFSGLKSNECKCTIVGIGALKGVHVALWYEVRFRK